MSENNKPKKNVDQPWERKFGEDEKGRAYTRSARNGKGKEVAPLPNVLLFVFLIMVIVPLMFMIWFYYQNNQSVVTPRTANEVMLTKVAETTTVETTQSTTATSSQETSQATTNVEVVETTVAPPVTEAVETAVQPVTPQETYGTYTVKAGDTLYRIALNHGMDVATLKAINGLTSDNVAIGTSLRVTQ